MFFADAGSQSAPYSVTVTALPTPTEVIPEPSTLLLVASGLGIAALRRKRR